MENGENQLQQPDNLNVDKTKGVDKNCLPMPYKSFCQSKLMHVLNYNYEQLNLKYIPQK